MSEKIVLPEVWDPYTKNRSRTVYLDRRELELFRAEDPWKYQNSWTARDVLQEPSAYLRAVRVGEMECRCCYAGVPQWIRNAAGKQIKLPDGHVFVVYVGRDDSVFEWRLERCHAQRRCLPHDFESSRFEGGVMWELPT